MPTKNIVEKSSARDIGPVRPLKCNSYQVPEAYQKKFTANELKNFKTAFTAFDANNNGKIETIELQKALKELNEDCSPDRVRHLIHEVDENNNGTIEFEEFLTVLDSIRTGTSVSGLGNIVQKHETLNKVQGKAGAVHSYSEEERIAFAEHINNCLRQDQDLQSVLPIDTASPTALFDAVKDGVLLCKLINQAAADTIDERALNISKNGKELSIYKKTENQNLAINAARGIGCTVINVGSQDLIEGRPILILGLIWQIVKIQLLSTITLKNYPELVRLLTDGEEMEDLIKLSPENILLRWMNFHLAEANHPKRVANFSKDITDSEAYLVVLHQVSSAVSTHLLEYFNSHLNSSHPKHVQRRSCNRKISQQERNM